MSARVATDDARFLRLMLSVTYVSYGARLQLGTLHCHNFRRVGTFDCQLQPFRHAQSRLTE